MKKPSPEKAKAPKAPRAPLETGKHAFYVGKFIPQTTRERVTEFLTGESEERLYSKEFYLALLQEAFGRTPEGERVKVVVMPQLSQFFNGEEDVEDALSAEDQIALIKKLAKKHFDREDIDVECAEDQPRHQALFQELREAVDPDTRQLNVEKALGGNTDFTLSESLDSLEMARYLYAVANEYEPLLNDSIAAAPEYWQQRMEEDSPMQYYAVAEAAIRLVDTLDGIEVQGGADRQWRFDKIIKKILGGKARNYRKCAQLKPLFERVKGLPFETAYIDTNENSYTDHKKELVKNVRTVIMATLGVAVATGAFYQGVEHEKKEQDRIDSAVDARLAERLKKQSFYLDGPKFKLPESSNVPVFKELVRNCLNDLYSRYEIGREHQRVLEPLLREYLVDKYNLDVLRRNGYHRIDEVDQFVHEHRITLQSMGINIGRPYAELSAHKEAMVEITHSEEDHRIELEKKYEPVGPVDMPTNKDKPLHPDLRSLGRFNSAQPFGNHYEFYSYTKDEKEYLLARDRFEEKVGERAMFFTSKKAREGARQFIYAMERYDALELQAESSLIYTLKYWKEREDEENWDSLCRGIKPKTTEPWAGARHYNDFLGRFEYAFTEESGYDKKKGVSHPCLLAKAPGDTHYTYERAREMIGRYDEMRDKWYDFYSGKYFEAMMPLDTLKLMEEARNMTNMILLWQVILQNEELPEYIEYAFAAAKNYYSGRFHEELGEFDGSYKATRDISESFERLKKDFESVKKYIEEYARSFPAK